MKALKWFVGMWGWVSVWALVIACISKIVPPVSGGLLMELLMLTGMALVAAVAATKLMAFLTAFLALVVKSFIEIKSKV
jgi:hypothetical protein